VQDGAAGTDGEASGGGQQPQPEAFRFPTPGLVRGLIGGVSAAVGHFDVEHCTFQLEPVGHREHETVHHR